MTAAFSDAFLHAAEYHAAWGAQQLEMIDQAFPAGPWTADLEQCRYESGGRSLRVGLLGSYDLAEQTWLWGWANPGLRGSDVVAASARIPEFGRRHGIVELQQEDVALAGFDDPRRAAEALAFLGMAVLGAPGYIGQEAGPETRVYFVPQDSQLQPARLDPVAMPRHLLTGAQLSHARRGWWSTAGSPCTASRFRRPPTRSQRLCPAGVRRWSPSTPSAASRASTPDRFLPSTPPSRCPGSATWGCEVPGAVLPGAKAAKGGSYESVVGTGGEQLLCEPVQFSSVAGEFWIFRKRYRGSQCSVAHHEVGVEKILGYGVEKRGAQGTQGFHVRIFKAVPHR